MATSPAPLPAFPVSVAPSGRSGLGTRMEPGKGIMAPVPGVNKKCPERAGLTLQSSKNGVANGFSSKNGALNKEEWCEVTCSKKWCDKPNLAGWTNRIWDFGRKKDLNQRTWGREFTNNTAGFNVPAFRQSHLPVVPHKAVAEVSKIGNL